MAVGRLLPLATLLLASLLLAGCAKPTDSEAKDGKDGPRVATTVYPLRYLTERVAGEDAEVVSITASGADPHSIELPLNAVARLSEASLVIYLSGFQPAVDEAISETGVSAFDVADDVNLLSWEEDDDAEHSEDEDEDEDDSHDHGRNDPHFWLDPMRMARAGQAVADKLADLNPSAAHDYAQAAAELRNNLESLAGDYERRLATCQHSTLIVSHEAFGYLADAYDLTQVGVAGIDPDSEPSPARIAEIGRIVDEKDVEAIFVEPSTDASFREALATELDVDVLELDPIEVSQAEGDYLATMENNLDSLTDGLTCS